MNISWTTIFVKDIEKSLAFYNGLLGLPVAMKFYGETQKLIMLGDENNAKVELLENPNVTVSAGNDTISMGFEVESLEEMTKKLTEAGFPVLSDMKDYLVRGMTMDGFVKVVAIRSTELVGRGAQIHKTTPNATAAFGRGSGSDPCGTDAWGENAAAAYQGRGLFPGEPDRTADPGTGADILETQAAALRGKHLAVSGLCIPLYAGIQLSLGE
jgi:lactoylglutathione lyase